MTTTFADLQTGDVFSFAALLPRESWEKTGPHRARVVNSDQVRNVGGDERVYVLYAAADRAARLREAPDHMRGDGLSMALLTPEEHEEWHRGEQR